MRAPSDPSGIVGVVITLMDRHTRSARLAVIGLLAVSLGAASCSGSVSVGGSDVAQAEVEAQVASQLAESVGSDVPPTIVCPGDLAAEVGATMTCELSVEGEDGTYPVLVEVTAVKDGVATFTAEVGEA